MTGSQNDCSSLFSPSGLSHLLIRSTENTSSPSLYTGYCLSPEHISSLCLVTVYSSGFHLRYNSFRKLSSAIYARAEVPKYLYIYLDEYVPHCIKSIYILVCHHY